MDTNGSVHRECAIRHLATGGGHNRFASPFVISKPFAPTLVKIYIFFCSTLLQVIDFSFTDLQLLL